MSSLNAHFFRGRFLKIILMCVCFSSSLFFLPSAPPPFWTTGGPSLTAGGGSEQVGSPVTSSCPAPERGEGPPLVFFRFRDIGYCYAFVQSSYLFEKLVELLLIKSF